jgi:hypothetical protein
LKSQGVNEKKANTLIDSLVQAGFESMQDLITFGVDFQDRPETLSTILKTDFNFNPLDAHKLRAALMEAISLSKKETASLTVSPLDIPVFCKPPANFATSQLIRFGSQDDQSDLIDYLADVKKVEHVKAIKAVFDYFKNVNLADRHFQIRAIIAGIIEKL